MGLNVDTLDLNLDLNVLYEHVIENLYPSLIGAYGHVQFISPHDLLIAEGFTDKTTENGWSKGLSNTYLEQNDSTNLYDDILKNGMYWAVLVKHTTINDISGYYVVEGFHRVTALKENNYPGKVMCFVIQENVTTILEGYKKARNMPVHLNLPIDLIFPAEWRETVKFEESMRCLGHRLHEDDHVFFDYLALVPIQAMSLVSVYTRACVSNVMLKRGETLKGHPIVNDPAACKEWAERHGLTFVE